MKSSVFRILAGLELTAVVLAAGARVPDAELRYSTVSRQVIEQRLKEFSRNNKDRESTLLQLFTEAGCSGAALAEEPVKGTRIPNVTCVLRGTSGDTIIVGAHFDHSPTGDGVVDNWSGASLLPSLYEAIKAEPHRHTYVFVGFTDEEKGLVGSRFYVKKMTKEQVAATDAMVNLDTLGLGSAAVWAGHADKQLSDALTSCAAKLNLSLRVVYIPQVTTDSEVFAVRKIPRITVHSMTQEAWQERIVDGPKDTLSAIHMDDYYRSYELISAYLVYLDQVAGGR